MAVDARARKVDDAKLSLGDLRRVRTLERREELVAALIDAVVPGPMCRRCGSSSTGSREGLGSTRGERRADPEERAMIEQMRQLAKLPLSQTRSSGSG